MRQEDLVSVIMPAFNSRKYIYSAMESALRQTYEKIELIVIDDGSSDGTADMVRKMARNDKRVSLYQNPVNMGTAAARDAGVRYSRGEWIALLDSDDCWEADKLERQLKAMEHTAEGEFCFTGSYFMNSAGMKLDGYLPAPE